MLVLDAHAVAHELADAARVTAEIEDGEAIRALAAAIAAGRADDALARARELLERSV